MLNLDLKLIRFLLRDYFYTGASWVVNIFLLGAKVFVLAESNSKAVAASLADSAVDLVSQVRNQF